VNSEYTVNIHILHCIARQSVQACRKNISSLGVEVIQFIQALATGSWKFRKQLRKHTSLDKHTNDKPAGEMDSCV